MLDKAGYAASSRQSLHVAGFVFSFCLLSLPLPKTAKPISPADYCKPAMLNAGIVSSNVTGLAKKPRKFGPQR